MFEAIQLAPQALSRGRPIKFTPERMQQISNLVEGGRIQDNTAEIIGITPDTLQAACSKLGISLRRHTFNIGAGLRSCSYKRTPPHQASPYPESMIPEPVVRGPQPSSGGKPIGEAKAATPSEGVRQARSDNPASAVLAIRITKRDEDG